MYFNLQDSEALVCFRLVMTDVAEVGPLQSGAWQPCRTLTPCAHLTRHYHRPENKQS